MTVSDLLPAIDPDEPETWPPALTAWVEETSRRYLRPQCSTESLGGEPGAPDGALALLDGRPVRAYHSTRLLPHECDAIRGEGLHLLTPELVQRKLTGALDSGALSRAEYHALASRTAYEVQPEWAPSGRGGMVWATVGRSLFRDDPHAVTPLLTHWGGEGIYMQQQDQRAIVADIGTPSIVVLNLHPSEDRHTTCFMPTLSSVLRAVAVGTEDPHADVRHRVPIPASGIVDIWQPGHPEYDVYPGLPQT